MGDASVLQFALLGGLLLTGTLVCVVALARGALRVVLARRRPKQRIRLILWLLLLPPGVGVAYAASTLLVPSLMQGTAALTSACAVHHGALLHACLWHPTGTEDSAVLWLGLATLALGAGLAAARALGCLLRGRREVMSLVRLSRSWPDAPNVHVVEAERLLAIACGIGSGRIVLSSSLLRSLSPRELEVVLAHEQAHLRHRDALVSLVARVASFFHLPAVRRDLSRALGLAMEQRCDLVAAGAVGSRVVVAETILAVERALRAEGNTRTPAHAAAFADGFVYERVHALLYPQDAARTSLGAWLTTGALLTAALSAGWLHHLTESLIALLGG